MSLLVIGGGPAGAAAAITARQARMDVTILDATRFPRFRPGETLHPGIEPLLEQLGVADSVRAAGYLRHAGTWVEWGERSEFVPFGADARGPWRGFQAGRDDFDQRLLCRARELGANVQEKRAARSTIVDGGRVVGVQTADGPVYATFTIDASGAKHWLARQLNIPILRHSRRLVARYGYAGNMPVDAERLPRIEADASGWTWTADLGQSRYLSMRVSEPAGRITGADVTWRLAAQTAGPGWFLCGDAAAVLDPSSSHGVLRAIMSGIMAAYIVVNEPEAAPAYHEWLSEWFQHDKEKMTEAYREVGLFGY